MVDHVFTSLMEMDVQDMPLDPGTKLEEKIIGFISTNYGVSSTNEPSDMLN
jgi:hypothetical protein